MTAPSPEAPTSSKRGRGRPKAPPSDWESFGTYLPESLARRFRSACSLRGIEIREGAREAVEEWVRAQAFRLDPEPDAPGGSEAATGRQSEPEIEHGSSPS
ncbi:hypothetical protein ACGF12_22795 [Kitasatospora sp. NPDC048296]|uniref:hypothetical protein n=1 Tax=Kitasatospora sp. NPDC048296 TaxID=3364048 RepID=UPI00371B3C89